MKIYYTNIEKKKLCNRNNGTLKTLPRIDFQVQSTFSVVFIDSLNKIIEIDPTDSFYIAGGMDVMKDSSNLLFYSEDFTLDNNMLRFTVNTYTDNYLKHIKNTGTPIYLEIGIINEKKTILLQDIVLAQPRVYLDGVAPINIEVYYTKAEIDKKFADVKIEQTDPIYTADKANIALKSEIPTKLSQLNNDEGFIKEQTDPVYTADKANIALKSELPTKLSQLENDEGYIKEQTDPIYTADKANIALKSELFSGDYNDLINKPIGLAGYKEIQNIAEVTVIEVQDFKTLKDSYYVENIDQTLTIPEFNFTGTLQHLEMKTIQFWIKNSNTVSVISIPDMFTVIDPDNFPTEFEAGKTAVFVIRFFTNGSKLNSVINYAYSFTEAE